MWATQLISNGCVRHVAMIDKSQYNFGFQWRKVKHKTQLLGCGISSSSWLYLCCIYSRGHNRGNRGVAIGGSTAAWMSWDNMREVFFGFFWEANERKVLSKLTTTFTLLTFMFNQMIILVIVYNYYNLLHLHWLLITVVIGYEVTDLFLI